MAKPPKTIEIGLFTRGKLIGQGTFANTYRVTTPDGQAALKHLRLDAPPGGPQRFQNEIWALKQLSHDSIPKFVDEGEHEDRPYVVMTLAPGKSLRRRLEEPVGDRGTFGERWVLRIVVAVLSAVCAAQKKGITHRDIKDDNVMVDDDAASIHLIDFGFCKGIDQPVDADSFFQVGAPRYSPPSKLRYPSVTHPTHDVFAVGVLAYLLLTNTYPWSVLPDQDHGILAGLMENSNPPEVTDLNSVVSYETAGFIRALISIEDNRRPTAGAALQRAKQLLRDSAHDQLRYPSWYRETFPKVSRDPIHGDIRLTESEADLLDQPPFQRLRLIKQLGFSNLVYLGAQHTRLAHSIGTMHVADRMAQAVVDGTGAKIDPEERLLIRLHALVHDIAHMPYGHTIEDELGFFSRHDQNVSRLDRLLTTHPKFEEAQQVLVQACLHSGTGPSG